MTRNLSFLLAALMLSHASAQLPSANYDSLTGIMTVDSGEYDLVAIIIEGPDATLNCNLCDGMNLPGTNATDDTSTWTLGFVNGSTQWIRTDPLMGRGFVGEIASHYIDGSMTQQPWPMDNPPFLDFPDEGLGIATYPTGLPSSAFGTITFATDDGSVFQCDTICTGNSPPMANDDAYEATLSGRLFVPAPGVLENDFDPDGDALTALLTQPPTYGEVTMNDDGSFAYLAPRLGTVPIGTIDTFYYAASDSFPSTDEAMVSITLVVPEPEYGWFSLVAGLALLRLRRR